MRSHIIDNDDGRHQRRAPTLYNLDISLDIVFRYFLSFAQHSVIGGDCAIQFEIQTLNVQ